MNGNELKQRQQGAETIIERCEQFARELGVDLKGVEWKEDIKQARKVYTLIVHVGPGPDEIPLGHAEIVAYSTRTGTEGTDEKLKKRDPEAPVRPLIGQRFHGQPGPASSKPRYRNGQKAQARAEPAPVCELALVCFSPRDRMSAGLGWLNVAPPRILPR